MATQAGPLRKRVRLNDGTTVILPSDAVIEPMLAADDKPDMAKPLGGTWK